MKTMAKKKNWLGMLVIALVFGMTVVGCGGSRLNGTWVQDGYGDRGVRLTFRGSNYELIDPTNRWNNHKGTFSLNGKKTELTLNQTHEHGGVQEWMPIVPRSRVHQIMLSGNELTLLNVATFTKQ